MGRVRRFNLKHWGNMTDILNHIALIPEWDKALETKLMRYIRQNTQENVQALQTQYFPKNSQNPKALYLPTSAIERLNTVYDHKFPTAPSSSDDTSLSGNEADTEPTTSFEDETTPTHPRENLPTQPVRGHGLRQYWLIITTIITISMGLSTMLGPIAYSYLTGRAELFTQ